MKQIAALIVVLFCLSACDKKAGEIKTGVWRAAIGIQGRELPFNLEVTRDSTGGFDMFIRNGAERLLLDEVSVTDDSIIAGLHIFDATIRARINGDSLSGTFIKNYEKDYRLPFRAKHGQEFRFRPGSRPSTADFTGTYEVIFHSDTTEAVGVFSQHGDSVTGTFMTPTGDYRYLQGNVANDTMQLSTFDGNHAYLFTAVKRDDGTLAGEFLSGKSHREQWTGRANENARLPDAESMTYLKEGYERIEFSFPDINGNTVTLNDPKYKNKVVILQLFGTWCPNCMDETRFLAPWYRQNRERGVEVIGLAYERKDDFRYASDRVRLMIDKLGVDYDFLIAGTNDKEAASKTLPMLNRVAAFPTLIFIGRDGKVAKIHTGFSGPGTGKYYEAFITDFNETIKELLSGNIALKNTQ